nr:hydantoinase/oxoprolinase N-terminal domain-containing protein [Paraburkholderia pallida]
MLAEAGVAATDLGAILHITTPVTNAVINRRGARTALLTTEGFRDVIKTGFEARADHYDLCVRQPAPLIPRDLRFTVARQLETRNIESLAIGFLHSYRDPRHERLAAERLAARLPSLWISLSSGVSPEVREFERFHDKTIRTGGSRWLCDGRKPGSYQSNSASLSLRHTIRFAANRQLHLYRMGSSVQAKVDSWRYLDAVDEGATPPAGIALPG